MTGLAAAWHLQTQCNGRYQVHVYESEATLGGHAHTMAIPHTTPKATSTVSSTSTTAEDATTTMVDLGFMVFNQPNYPNLRAWFRQLNIAQEKTDMSLSISLSTNNDDENTPKKDDDPPKRNMMVEWCSSRGLRGLLAHFPQVWSYSFWQFIYDLVIRFHAVTPHTDFLALPSDDPRQHVTLGQYLQYRGYSSAVATHYLVPMMAALWSATSLHDVLEFPAAQLLGFLANHQMLQILHRPQWYTVTGRSHQYTQKLHVVLATHDAVHVNSPVHAVVKNNNKNNDTTSFTLYGPPPASASTNKESLDDCPCYGTYDQVIFACHAPTAGDMLRRGEYHDTALVQALLDIRYEPNVIYVHSDVSLMPQSRNAWASWNCLGDWHALQRAVLGGPSTPEDDDETKTNDDETTKLSSSGSGVYVTYWLNQLQNLTCQEPIFVSLNPPRPPHHQHCPPRIWSHPQFTLSTLRARQYVLQQQYQTPKSNSGLWFCGAWDGYGFHEDGCRSGFHVATELSGVPVPWKSTTTSSTTAKTEPPPATTLLKDKDKNNDMTLAANPETQLFDLVEAPPDFVSTLTQHAHKNKQGWLTAVGRHVQALYQFVTREVPIGLAKYVVRRTVTRLLSSSSSPPTDPRVPTQLQVRHVNGTLETYGTASSSATAVTVRVFDDWFFVKLATSWFWGWSFCPNDDVGLATSYMEGLFNVQAIADQTTEDDADESKTETCIALGDPTGLLRLFSLWNHYQPGNGTQSGITSWFLSSWCWWSPYYRRRRDGMYTQWYQLWCKRRGPTLFDSLIRRALDPETAQSSTAIFSPSTIRANGTSTYCVGSVLLVVVVLCVDCVTCS